VDRIGESYDDRERRLTLSSPFVIPVPAAAARTHLLAAAVMWAVVGSGLAVYGAHNALAMASPLAPYLAVAAVLAGAAKARWVLAKAAGRIVARIIERGDGKCLGGFLSPTSWALVAVMVISGRILRRWVLPPPVVGLLYLAVGTALLLASLVIWRSWRTAGPRTAL